MKAPVVQAPAASTFVALALLPVAFLFTHALLSGMRGWRHHALSGMIAVSWDLSLSVFYMLYRTFGGVVDGSVLAMTPSLTAYFAVHGIVAVIVMALEVVILATGIMQLRRKAKIRIHRRIAIPLYVLWLIAFFSGEIVYLVYYVL